ncbi:hypothetical protein [Calothrix sp. NIES-2100]|uniref:hypothetical protein n=1 Tax=Calothrix sp. NIES-2100 TaxID=1954172 RepID=UPI0030DCC71A
MVVWEITLFTGNLLENQNLDKLSFNIYKQMDGKAIANQAQSAALQKCDRFAKCGILGYSTKRQLLVNPV